MHQIIQVPGIPAIGPYSQAVRANGLLFVSGQRGIDPATGVASATFAEQARQAFENLRVVLEAGGSGLDRIEDEYTKPSWFFAALRMTALLRVETEDPKAGLWVRAGGPW